MEVDGVDRGGVLVSLILAFSCLNLMCAHQFGAGADSSANGAG